MLEESRLGMMKGRAATAGWRCRLTVLVLAEVTEGTGEAPALQLRFGFPARLAYAMHGKVYYTEACRDRRVSKYKSQHIP